MRIGVWALAGLVLGAVAAHFLLPANGYVLISFRDYMVEMSVPALVIVLVIGYWLLRLTLGVWRWPGRLGARLAERRQRGALKRLDNALLGMVEGDWRKGERLLTRGLKSKETPLINYLMAARAAQRQGSTARRDEWLQIAHQELPQAENAVLVTQAELQLDAGELERALATLRRLEEIAPGHPMGLALLARTYERLGEWQSLVGLLPRLGAAELDDAERTRLAASALEHYWAGTPAGGAEGIAATWASLPASLKSMPQVLSVYALALARVGQGGDAEQVLRAALRRQWHGALVAAYGRVAADDPARQLRRAEGWLEQHPEDSELLLAAARLCIRTQLWGKARSYLESSLALHPSPDAYALYGELLAELGEQDRASEAYRSGLGLAAPGVELPALGGPAPRRRAPARSA